MKHTKKVLILVSKRPKNLEGMNWDGLKSWLGQLLSKDTVVEISALDELVYAVGEHLAIYDPMKKYDLADFDVVIMRTVGTEMERAIAAAHYLHAKDVPFTDSYVLTQGRGKLACSFAREAHGLPVPQTVYAAPNQLSKAIKDAHISYPLILKADQGKKGNDNYLIQSAIELKKTLALYSKQEVSMIAQEYIPNEGDYRILVLNNVPRFAFFRKGSGESHLNNTSKGGKAFQVDLRELSATVLKDAVRAAEIEKLEVAGVDLIIDKQTQRHYILEVNRAPQIPTGAFAAEKMATYATLIQELLAMGAKADDIKHAPIIGRAERIDLPEYGVARVPAKVDTGADISSIWASNITERAGKLSFTLFGQGSEFYTGKTITLAQGKFSRTRIANSFGTKETRYLVKLKIKINDRVVNGSFTLADRSMKVYPILLGRRLLRNKFLVDVAAGKPLAELEQGKKKKLHVELGLDED